MAKAPMNPQTPMNSKQEDGATTLKSK